jgi:ABC-type uncharacterized transport system involved in gliding motility auxiliary subunit
MGCWRGGNEEGELWHDSSVQNTALCSCISSLNRFRPFFVCGATAQLGPRLVADAATYTTHNRRTPTPSTRFETATPAIEGPQANAFDSMATRIERVNQYAREIMALLITT